MRTLMGRASVPLTAFLAMVATGACGDAQGPGDGQEGTVPNSPVSLAPSPGMDVLRRAQTLEEDKTVTKPVRNSAGGWLEIEAAGIKVHLPAGALGDDPNVEMDVTLVAKAGVDVTWHIEPRGLELSQPVTVFIETSNTNASHLLDRKTPSGPSLAQGVSWDPGAKGTDGLNRSSVYYSDSGHLVFQTVHPRGLITL